MSGLCDNAVSRDKHEIGDGEFTIYAALTVDFGFRDERAASSKEYRFCSYACLAAYAADRGNVHDPELVS